MSENEFYISEELLQKAFEISAGVYEKAHDGDHFHASDFYLQATTIVPDMTFGLLGARFLTNDDYMAMFRKQSDRIRDVQKEDGNLWRSYNRSMYQVMYPIWVYLIYIYTGDRDYVVAHKDSVKKSFEYVFNHEDSDGFIKIIGHGEWRYSEGADWVDWCAERMEGKTMVFQTWYYRSLLTAAYIMEVAGEYEIAALYRRKAEFLKDSLNRIYWRETHYLDNIDFNGWEVDQFWLDSQVWPIFFGIADEDQSMCILSHIENMGKFDEGVPVRWRESIDVGRGSLPPGWRDNGNCTWFGRLGSGAILARYSMRQNLYAYGYLKRISELFVRDEDVYECYDMEGNAMQKNIGGGNYLEHAGGYINAVKEGLFGIEFPLMLNDSLKVHPRFSGERNVWPGYSKEVEAATSFKYLGKTISYSYSSRKLDEAYFERVLELVPEAGAKMYGVRVEMDFVHPLPVFTSIEEITVNGRKVEGDIDAVGAMVFEEKLPCSIKITYRERSNTKLEGLPPDQALSDSQ